MSPSGSNRAPGLRAAISTPGNKAPYVRRLFATIADRYDLITVLLSYGQDRRWKRRLVSLAGPFAGRRVLDLACGTGDITFLAAAAGGTAVGLDITHRMLQLARDKSVRARRGSAAGPLPSWVGGDLCALPFPAESFDVLTAGYGLRNVPDLDRALAEAARVLRSGGRLVSLDFNRPDQPAVRGAYLAYLSVVGGALGWVLHRDPDTYRYIPESIRTYPGAAAVADMMRDRGFRDVSWHPVLGGLMAIHSATRR